jgi:uncharacterized phiE125 gp8 family phage protein
MPLTGGYTEIVTAPTALPISLTDAKRHLRITEDDEDALLVDYLHACRQYAETQIPGGMALLTTTLDLKLPDFPGARERLYLPLPPLSSVTSVTYYNENATTSTLTENTDFVVHKPATGQGWLVPVPSEDWPDTQDERDNAVTVRFVAGYTQATLPPQIKQAIRLALGGFYEYRESMISGTIIAELPVGAKMLLESFNYGFVG